MGHNGPREGVEALCRMRGLTSATPLLAVLGPISSAVYELEAVQHGLVRKSAFTNGKSDYEAAQARAEEACGHHLLQVCSSLSPEQSPMARALYLDALQLGFPLAVLLDI